MLNKVPFAVLLILVSSSFSVFGLNPAGNYASTPAKLKMKHEEKKVQTEDGASLNLWYFPTSRISNKFLIVSHNGDGNMGDNLNRIKSLVAYGFNVISFDYRGYGSSSAFDINDEVYIYPEFYKDFEAVYNYTVNNFGKKIYVYGWGIGATISITMAYDKPNTYTIVADSPIAQYDDMPSKFSKIGSRMYVHRDVINNYKDPFTTMGQMASPNFRGLMLMVGSHDFLFTKSDMESLKERVKSGNTDLYVFDNKASKENYRNNPTLYMRKIHHFLVNN